MTNSTLPNSDVPLMSTPETLANIFFEPGRTFEALRQRPRFLAAGLIIAALSTIFTFFFFQKVNFDRFMREQIESNPRTAQMSAEDKERTLRMQTSPFVRRLSYVSPLIAVVIFIAAGGALYMLGAMALGGQLSYREGLSIWAYSSYPPTLLAMLANFLLLFLKSADDIDPAQSAGGLVRANLGLLLGADASPILKAVLGSFDLFAFFGLFLAATGVRKLARLSTGAAWTVVIGIWLLGILLKVGWAAITGRAV